MLETEGGGSNLVKLYDKYNREDALAAYGLVIAGVITIGTSALLLATTPLSGYANRELLEKMANNVVAAGSMFVAEGIVGFVGWKRSEARKHDIALQIAQAEGRVVDETNDKRVMYASALATTLVYGIEFKPSLLSNLANTFSRPIWENWIPNVTPERRKTATFRSFDRVVELLTFDEWTKREVGLAALNLGKKRWELITRGQSSNRLKGYSFEMISEIDRRLGDAFPQS